MVTVKLSNKKLQCNSKIPELIQGLNCKKILLLVIPTSKKQKKEKS